MNPIAEKYLRKEVLPFLFCPGCGNGTILGAVLRAIDRLDIINDLALVGGIGCSGWIPTYINADVVKCLHGRTLPVATGIKMSNTKRKVLVFSGDGDCLGIGGTHLIHSARRNIDVTVIMVNNQIYGMTGGQMAPTTPYEAKTKTSIYGNIEYEFDACELVKSAGATYVARWTSAHPVQLQKSVENSISHKGFAFIEVLTQCPTQTGRLIYETVDPTALLNIIKSQTVSIKASKKLNYDELKGKFKIGKIFHDKQKSEFSENYSRVIKKSTSPLKNLEADTK